MGGFVKVAREFDGVELVGIKSPLWPKTGTGSGWVTQEAYETFVGRMIAELKAQRTASTASISACMARWRCAACRGPEAELARRVREVVGPKAFIAGDLRSARQRGRGISRITPTWRSR